VRNVHLTELGAGTVTPTDDGYQLYVPPTDVTAYHDAQFADYTLPARDFAWEAPVTMRVRAWFNTADVRGTAGFGFWNHPFSPEMRGLPRPPQAAWFFYGSPPNDMPLARGVPGAGWKAATISARRPQFWALAPFTLPGVLMMRVPMLYRALWPLGQDALAIREALLPPDLMTRPTDYALTWDREAVRFAVDGATVLESPFRLTGRMGFIAWIDNQYAVVTPQGRFGWGVVDVPAAQSLTVTALRLSV
jgi:hypothetical protein